MCYTLAMEDFIYEYRRKIKYFRLAHGITQEQLAQDAEISHSTLRKYEANERNPKYEQLLKIADALGISVNIFTDFDIRTMSDFLSLIFKMNEQLDLQFNSEKTHREILFQIHSIFHSRIP